MKFNVQKCKIMHFGRNNPHYIYTMGGQRLVVVEEEKDVGVWIHNSLKPAKHCKRAANTAMGVLDQLRTSFHFRDRNIFMKLYKQYVRPHLEFATPVWSPWLRSDIDIIETVQKRAVNMVPGLHVNTYEEKCKKLKIDTLEERRIKQDLTQVFKIMKNVDEITPERIFKFRPQGNPHS